MRRSAVAVIASLIARIGSVQSLGAQLGYLVVEDARRSLATVADTATKGSFQVLYLSSDHLRWLTAMTSVLRRCGIAFQLCLLASAQSPPPVARNPPPIVRSISPFPIVAGSPDTRLVIGGEGFAEGALARLDSIPLTTTQVSAELVTAVAPAALIANTGMRSLTIANPDGQISAAYNTGVAAPSPGVTSLEPSVIPAGEGAFTLAINGHGFLPGLVVKWDSTDEFLTNLSVTPTRIVVAVPAHLVERPGVVKIWISQGGTSNPLTLRIGVPLPSTQPVISSFSPTSGPNMGPDFVLTINGNNFDPSAMIVWGGTGIKPTHVSGSQLVATILSGSQTPCPFVNFSVRNPGADSDLAQYFVDPAPAAVLALSPRTYSALQGEITLTVRGYGFSPGVVVRWDDTATPTTFVDSSRLTAAISEDLLIGTSTKATPATPRAAARVSVVALDYTTGWLPFEVTGPRVFGLARDTSETSLRPGSLLSIEGAELATGIFRATSMPLPTSLGGTTLLVDGIAAQLVSVSPSRIDARMPSDIKPGTLTLVVRVNLAASPPVFIMAP
jgi:hypothetical protein